MTWDDARERCFNQGGDLAIVDSETKRQTIAKYLTEIDNLFPDVNIQAFIGIRKLGRWQWLGGMSISVDNIWHPGYPHILWSGECGVLVKYNHEWKLLQTSCVYTLGFMCETHDSKYTCMPNAFSFGFECCCCMSFSLLLKYLPRNGIFMFYPSCLTACYSHVVLRDTG